MTRYQVWRKGERAILVRSAWTESSVALGKIYLPPAGFKLAFEVAARSEKEARDMAIGLADPPLRALGTVRREVLR